MSEYEEWRPAVGHEGRLEVSNLGRVRSVDHKVRNRNGLRSVRGRIRKLGMWSAKGYPMLRIGSKAEYVHQMVARAFLGPCPEGKEVNHIDNVRTNDRLYNLEYVTRKENVRHAMSLGVPYNRGTANPSAKLNVEAVKVIRHMMSKTSGRSRYGTQVRLKLAALFGVSKQTIFDVARQRSWKSVVVAALAALMAAIPSAAVTRLEFVEPLFHDTSNNPAADPSNPRAMGASILVWHGQPRLVYSDGNELRHRRIYGDGSLGPYSQSHFDVPPPSDQDFILMGWAFCDDCRYGLAAYNTQGTVLFDMGEGNSPLISQGVRYQDAGSLGGLTWMFGGRQYIVSRVPPGCQGWSVAEITGVQVADLRVVQCVESSTGVPISVDGGVWMPESDIAGWVYLLDSNLRRVYPYRVTQQFGGSDPDLTAFQWQMQAVCIRDCGLAVAWPERMAVSAYSDGMRVWDVINPTAPVLLSTTALPIATAGMSVELRWPYGYVSTMAGNNTGTTHWFDLTDPAHPVELTPEFWWSEQPWNSFNYMSNKGGAWWGDHLYLTRYSVGERFDLVIDPDEEPLFADGLETGTVGAWSEVMQ